MRATTWLTELELRYPFGISRGSVDRLPTLLLRLDAAEGPAGVGEAAPVRYLGVSAADHRPVIERLVAALAEDAADDPRAAIAGVRELAEGVPAALAAVDVALWDRAARRRGLPLHAHLGLPPPAGLTTYTIALDTLEAMAARGREAAALPLLKIKLGRDPDFDRAAIDAVAAAAPRARLRVDANGGWSFDQARALLPHLADRGVEMVEQPLARGALAALEALRRGSPLPIFADEDVQSLASLPALRGRVDGINIKLMKCGGISEALAMIDFARGEGWQILLGCMIESRVGLAAAAQLSGSVDALDLDAHMLTVGDPVPPGSLERLDPAPPALAGPGIGVDPDGLAHALAGAAAPG
ncbi:MAG: dipeptide epimerase [Myxococcales bacterium]|nr:dipeptide epimerase [Myxococcales bacterium]MCB9701966.1 dipeptide epimerase [Myxococcales bacterium]